MKKITLKDYLAAAVQDVEDQVAENPTLGIPVDPDIAVHMGAFEEDWRTLQVIDEEIAGNQN
jgi:hypothetical protein